MAQDWAVRFPDASNFFIDAFILPGMKSDSTLHSPFARGRSPAPAAAAKRTRDIAAKPASAALPVDDDAALCKCLEGICAQRQAALGQFYDLTVGRVYGVALRIVRRAELAEEVVSDVYMQVWRDADRYDVSRGKVLGWLLVIARSRALDLLRRQDEAFSHPEPWELATDLESAHDNPQDLLEATQTGSAVHAAMLKLNPLQRQLLSLAFFRGLTHSEIVEHSGIPLGSVKTHIRRALAILRETLGTDVELNAAEA